MIIILIIITRDAFGAAKSALSGPRKVFNEKVKSCFSNFVNIMANVFLIKEIGSWVFLK